MQKGKGKNINRRQRGSSTGHKVIEINNKHDDVGTIIANSRERDESLFIDDQIHSRKEDGIIYKVSLTFKIQTISMSDYFSIIFFFKD